VEYDVFISHASEDKERFVEPLAQALKEAGLKVWYDRFELKLGDSLREKIDQGLTNSRYGVVVLSEAFLAKKWPKTELDALVTRQNAEGKKVLLPVWYEVGAEEVKKFSPILVSKMAARSSDGIEAIVAQILSVCSEKIDSEPMSVFKAGGSYGLREQCLEIIRRDDLLAWRKFVKELANPIPKRLIEWKAVGESAAPKGTEAWEQALVEAATVCLPGFVPIFAAVEAGKKNYWEESLHVVKRLAILEPEMGAGTVCALRVGSHMLYVVSSFGLAMAANLRLLDFIDDWMKMPIPDRQASGEQHWVEARAAHHLPEDIRFDVADPFRFIKKIYRSEYLKGFFASEDQLVDSLMVANLLASLIELRLCAQRSDCLKTITDRSNYYMFKVYPVWCLMDQRQFQVLTLELFGDSAAVVRFVFPSGFTTAEQFWPLWKSWKEICLTRWWRGSSGQYDFLIKKPWMLLPGEPPDS